MKWCGQEEEPGAGCGMLLGGVVGRQLLDRVFCFFFQAEDGIRDYKVTGVQTCALPILAERALYLPSAGLALAAGAWLKDLETRRLAVVLSLLVVAGGVRTALRVPVWRGKRGPSGRGVGGFPPPFARGPPNVGVLLHPAHTRHAAP